MDERLQRALKEAERAGIKLIPWPPDLVLDLVRVHTTAPLIGGQDLQVLDMLRRRGTDHKTMTADLRRWLVDIGAAQPGDWNEIDAAFARARAVATDLFSPIIEFDQHDQDRAVQAMDRLRRVMDTINAEEAAKLSGASRKPKGEK